MVKVEVIIREELERKMFMKKKIIIIISIGLVFVSFIVGILAWFNNKRQAEKMAVEEKERYEEIRNKFEEAVKQNINATFVIHNEYNCTHYNEQNLTSRWLIYQGNLKKEDMLDVDGESYCKALAKTYMGDNCTIKYNIYLSCKNYTDEGYKDI